MNHRNPQTSDWLDALGYLAEQSDAPPEARDAAHGALTAYGRAIKLRDSEGKLLKLAAEAENESLREAPKHLTNSLRAGTKANLDKVVEHLQMLSASHNAAKARAEFASRAFYSIETNCKGRCLAPFRDDLLIWVGQRRNHEPTAFGYADAIPEAVAIIYESLQADWVQDWEERLTLHASRRLPLIYEQDWDNDYRASLAWVWEQVSLGHFQKVAHPNDRSLNPKTLLLAPTRRVVTLPAVPPRTRTANR